MLMRLILCCALFFLAAESRADHSRIDHNNGSACGDITVAFYEHGALYYRTPDGKLTGIDKDVIDELGRRSGCHFHSVLESRVRIWSMLASGGLDMSVSGIATPERQKTSRFITYFSTRNYVLFSKDLPVAAQSLEGFLDDKRYQVAVVRGFKHGQEYDEWLDKLRLQGRVVDAADFNAVIRLLKIGRVHAALALPTSWVPILKQENMTESVKVMDLSSKTKLIYAGLILSRQRIPESTAVLIEKTIREMREDGTLESIFKRHIGADLAHDMLNY